MVKKSDQHLTLFLDGEPSTTTRDSKNCYFLLFGLVKNYTESFKKSDHYFTFFCVWDLQPLLGQVKRKVFLASCFRYFQKNWLIFLKTVPTRSKRATNYFYSFVSGTNYLEWLRPKKSFNVSKSSDSS